MINKKLKNLSIWIMLISFISISWIYSYKNFTNNVYSSDPNYIADFDDNNKVSWTAENVFVWEVVENLWSAKGESGLPVSNTNFKVNVLYNIKWKVKWNITVTQEAGYDNLWNLYIMSGNKFLQVWDLYLLSTLWDTYTIISHPNGSHFLTTNILDWKKDVKKFIKENIKVKEFREAYKNEVYYQENDEWEKYKISSEKNAYKNLWEKEKNDFENIENGFEK